MRILHKLKDKKGFTLIELIVVIAILGILAAILIPKFTGFQDKARSTQALVNAKNIATALDGSLAEGTSLASIKADDSVVLTVAGITLGSGDSLTITGSDTTHPGFTYVFVNGKTYTCIRADATGTFTTTWS